MLPEAITQEKHYFLKVYSLRIPKISFKGAAPTLAYAFLQLTSTVDQIATSSANILLQHASAQHLRLMPRGTPYPFGHDLPRVWHVYPVVSGKGVVSSSWAPVHVDSHVLRLTELGQVICRQRCHRTPQRMPCARPRGDYTNNHARPKEVNTSRRLIRLTSSTTCGAGHRSSSCAI